MGKRVATVVLISILFCANRGVARSDGGGYSFDGYFFMVMVVVIPVREVIGDVIQVHAVNSFVIAVR